MQEEKVTPVPFPPGRKLRSHRSGSLPGRGTYLCLDCGAHLALHEDEPLPPCPRCSGPRFARDSIFEQRQDQSQSTPTAEFEVAEAPAASAWLESARETVPVGARPVVGRARGPSDHRLPGGWTRIGRSVAADLKLDDPSVSRRHALIVSEPGKPLRILDDRSLNGVFLNGERVEWGPLGDGDELAIGCFHLHVVAP